MPHDIWTADVLDYWFRHLEPRHWFAPNPDIDEEIRDRFEPLWVSQRREQAMFFLTDPRVALAAIILFDQFPRNIFRNSAHAFAAPRPSLKAQTTRLWPRRQSPAAKTPSRLVVYLP